MINLCCLSRLLYKRPFSSILDQDFCFRRNDVDDAADILSFDNHRCLLYAHYVQPNTILIFVLLLLVVSTTLIATIKINKWFEKNKHKNIDEENMKPG